MKPYDGILITGASGMVGHALVDFLEKQGFYNVYKANHIDYNLKNLEETQKLFCVKPDYVFHLAARVHGIGGNSKFKADILFDNIMINTNVIECARVGVKKIVVMGSGCVYPELNTGPLKEDQIWNGPPHKSEDSYAHSKRLMLAQLAANKEQYGMNYAFAISGNLYGEYDNFDPEHGHVIPSLIAKFYEAKKDNVPVKVWGSGIAERDFSYSRDTAKALFLLMKGGDGPINIGSGFIHKIKDIVDILQNLTGIDVDWDSSKPDGQLKRFYDLSILKSLGFEPYTSLEKGIGMVWNWYCTEREKNER